MHVKRSLTMILIMVLFFASCASKPPAPPAPEPAPPIAVPEPQPQPKPEPKPEPQPVAEPVVVPQPEPEPEPVISPEELASLHAQVLAMRKNAVDLGLPVTHMVEYREADAVYIPAKAALDKDDRPVARKGLTEALELFTKLVEREAPLFAAAKARIAESARSRAYNAGASAGSPVALAAAEALMSDARRFMEVEDYRAAILSYMQATTAFDAAEKGSRASAVKARIDELGFASLDPGNYQIASTKLVNVNTMVVHDPSAAQDAAEEALLRFNLALAKSWELSAGTRRARAEANKNRSESIKAQVAVRNLYSEAKAVWDAAAAAHSAGRFEDSAPLFDEAEGRFLIVYQIAAEKKAAADLAMRQAAEKSAESSAILQKGEAELAGGE
jgi:hypothetical protein